MTVMDPRPWSPSGPHIGPDDEDLAYLAPTGDPEADLGSAVFVVHRVGGAACEVVARSPLPDDYRLVDALARGREALAPRAVEAVSKCLGRDDAYPDLLLRDLFDAGELGALAVYRACVAKGVAPPLAVQRAGLVYGVPQHDLGRYLAVAADPRAHPVAIADAADRAIAKWASGVVREELGEPVSKRSVLEYNHTQQGEEHPKGQRGRFVTTLERESTVAPTAGVIAGRTAGVLAGLRRSGIGGQAAPDVAVEPALAPPVTAAEAPPTREVRETRETRAVRQTRDEAKVEPKVRTSVQAQLHAQVTADLGARVAARINAQLRRPSGEQMPDVQAPIKDTGVTYGTIDPSITMTWSMAANQGEELFWTGLGPADRKNMRMGDLVSTLQEPYRHGTAQHDDQMISEAIRASEYQPKFKRIPGEDLALDKDFMNAVPGSSAQRQAVRRFAERHGYSRELAVDPETDRYEPERMVDQSVAPSAVPKPGGTTDWFVVQSESRTPASTYGDEVGIDIDEPIAAEFVVDASRAPIRGNVDRFRGIEHFDLDPTQPVVVRRGVQMWKATGPTTGFWVMRYTVHADDSDVVKAVSVLERPRTAWQTEPRDAGGRWATSRGVLAPVAQRPVSVAAEEKLEVPTEAPPLRAVRETRESRAVRQSVPAATVRGEVQGKVLGRADVRLDPQFRVQLQATMAELEEEEPPKPRQLSDLKVHVLMDGTEFNDFFDDYLQDMKDSRFMHDPVKPKYDLHTNAKAYLLYNHPPIDGEQVADNMQLNVLGHVKKRGFGLQEVGGFAQKLDPTDKRAVNDLKQKMHNYMAAHPEVGYMQIGKKADDPRGMVRVFRNARPIPDQVLIYMPEDLDPDEPARLVYIGKASQMQVSGNWNIGEDEDSPINAPIQVYRYEKKLYRTERPGRDE